MLKKIIYLSPHKTALHVSIVFGILSLVFMAPFLLAFYYMPKPEYPGLPEINFFVDFFFWGLPLVYFITTYIFVFLSTLIFNLVAKMTGGIPVKLAEEESFNPA